MKILSKNLFFVLLMTLGYSTSYAKSHKFHEPKVAISIEHAHANENQSAVINLEVELAKGQQVYANSIYLSVDAPQAPHLTLSKPEFNKSVQGEHDANINDSSIFRGIFTISVMASYKENINQPVNLHLSFLVNHPKRIFEKVFPIVLPQDVNATLAQNLAETQEPITQLSDNKPQASQPSFVNEENNTTATWWDSIAKFSTWLQASLRTSNSLALRLILVFLLGLLMSLTPCIYPMIPITAGILQAQGSSSLKRSFLLAFIYTLGTSTTFAIFGLIAALTHHLFGQLLVNPIFILAIVALLGYLGLSMFGIYDMYVPKFMAQTHYTQKKGSLLSVFLFGVVSGSMASPCLSPGLALLLSIVATLGSKFLGFIMLFMFGLGLSVPLLIVGTFSNSINRLPQSGTWMVEVKKLFGFMLLGMCVYLLSNIVSPLVTAWIIAAFVFGSGVYYLQNASRQEGNIWYLIKNFLGSVLIILAVVMSVQTLYKTYFAAHLVCENSTWQTDYNLAFQKAQEQNQNLLIDCGADWCSICKSIDKYVFEDHAIKAAMCNLVAVKVNATDQYSEPYQTLKMQYGIKGVPAILLINPHTGELLARWGSDLYDLPKAEFVSQLAEFKD